MNAPGPVRSRQDRPHPHQALFDPTGKFVLVPDLGADKIRVFRVEGTTFTQLPDIDRTLGSGPRHGAFITSSEGEAKFYYLVNELNNSVSVFKVTYSEDGNTIGLEEIQSIPTLPEPTPTNPDTAPKGTPSAAAYAFSPTKERLYVSNRNDPVFNGTHSIAAYQVDQITGQLSLIEYFPSGVLTPRHISIDPTGEYFLAEGQDSNNVKVYKIDQTTGKVATSPASVFNTRGPVCISWNRFT
jgi:6-phosphogluconolactonase